MAGPIYTIEELMLDDSFISYCLSTGAAVPSHWRAIIRDNPDQEKTFDDAKKLVLSLHGGVSRPEVKRQIEIVRRQLKERRSSGKEVQTEQGPSLSSAFVVTGEGQIKRRFLRTVLSYTAAICLIVMAAWFFFFKSASHSSGSQPPQAQVLNYQSPLGQRQTVSLPDGSIAILNSNSSISLNADFHKEKREIYLTGDAFFRVANNEKKPFIVYAENIATTALGTEFYVHGKKDPAKGIQVDLLEGKVKMADIKKDKPGAAIILLPGETGKSIGASNLAKGSFDSVHLRSWLNGRISFNETPVLKAFKQLETWYGIEINVKKAGLKNRSISGEYQHESLQDILKMICFSINSQYAVSDNIVIIE